MNERSWLVPSLGLTLASAGFALALLPGYGGILPALQLLPMWVMVAALAWALVGPVGLLSMMLAGVKSPFAHLAATVRGEWRALLLVCIGTLLAGFNMVTFMWTKPLLNILVPFHADPLLADLDKALFLGTDPWRLLDWMNSIPTALFYHRGWFAMMIGVLLVVLSRPPSREKSAVMLSYFMLWTLFGPIVHCLLPAGGPVFFDDLGYGNRFAAIWTPDEMQRMSAYLWTSYTASSFGPGSGISAMPSMHIATTAWMVLAIHIHAPRWTWLVAALGIVIFLLSISLGWHYAADGIVGGLGAIGCYRLCLWLVDPRRAATPTPALSGGA